MSELEGVILATGHSGEQGEGALKHFPFLNAVKVIMMEPFGARYSSNGGEWREKNAPYCHDGHYGDGGTYS